MRVWLSGAAIVLGLGGITGCGSNSSTGGSGAGAVGGGSTTTTTTTTTTTATGGTGGTGGQTSTTSSSSTSTTSTSTTSTMTGTGGMGTGGTGTGGTGPVGLPLGSDCTQNADCQSMLCKPVVIDTNPVCVIPCTQQSDCGTGTNYFCEPITAGSTSGYCIPHSPAHCLSCTMSSDCGSLSEVCFQAPGDNSKACHIDCSIAGQSACPSDYSCVAETVNGQPRMLCRPTQVSTCLDALGGYCDRLGVPQPCTRTNATGSCTGERTCLMPSKRFDVCSASAPQCKADCSLQDPAGCMETYCAAATSTPTNCGTCGMVCPGYGAPNDNVTCNVSQQCTFSCQGENYDVDGATGNGCEQPDSPTGNHSQSSAADQGSVSDCDSNFSFSGQLVSDARVHENPAVVGFDTSSGSAPDWYQILGVGHTFCENDIVLTLTMQGSAYPSCYQFNVITDKNNYSCQTDSTGACGFNDDSGGQFSDNTEIYIEIKKICGTNASEDAHYTVSGHL